MPVNGSTSTSLSSPLSHRYGRRRHLPLFLWWSSLVVVFDFLCPNLLPSCAALAIFPSHQWTLSNVDDFAGPVDGLNINSLLLPMDKRKPRSFAQSFPYSALSFYQSLKPEILRQIQAARAHEQQNDELAQLLGGTSFNPVEEQLAGKGQTAGGKSLAGKSSAYGDADNKRDRRSEEGSAMFKRYTCRFKFCRIFSPIEKR